MKKTFLPILRYILLLSAGLLLTRASGQQNITQLAHLPYDSGVICNNLTGYTDSLGREYALVGTSQGLSIVAIDTSMLVVNDSIDTTLVQPVQLFLLTDSVYPNASWVNLSIYKGYAYVTSRNDSGMMVVNLNYLPDSVSFHIIQPGGMTMAQTIFIDEHGTAYLNGTDSGQLFLALDSNLWSPPVAGKFTNNFVHDCFVRNNTMWAVCPYENMIQAVDVSDKTDANNPSRILATIPVTETYNHNCWLSNDNQYLFTAAEYPGSFLTCFNVSDLGNIYEIDMAQAPLASNINMHNVYYQNNYVLISYQTYGVAIFDVLRRNNMLPVAHFETSDTAGTGNGCTGLYPYLPSGYIIAADKQTGLWILQFGYNLRAGYLEGAITDSLCGTALSDVTIRILGDSSVSYSNSLGYYGTGTPDTGTFTLEFSKPGYKTLDTSGFTFTNGFLHDLNIDLVPDSTSNLTVVTTDSATADSLPYTRVLIQDTSGNVVEEVATNYLAEYNFCNFLQGTYNFFAGRWGRETARLTVTDSVAVDTLLIPTAVGYFDNFIMDYGWTVKSTCTTGAWVLGKPVGKMYSGQIASPYSDAPGDYGDQCYITGNAEGPATYDDVDSGYTTLSSPLFNIFPYNSPHISYYRWFFDGGSHPNDTMWVMLTNGFDTAVVDTVVKSDSVWIHKDIRIRSYIDTFSENMQISFKVQNYGGGNVLKAGVDLFTVYNDYADTTVTPPDTTVDTTGIIVIVKQNPSLKAYPNPFSEEVNIAIQNFNSDNGNIVLSNTLGQTIYVRRVTNRDTIIQIRQNLPSGVYIAKLLDRQNVVASTKIIKTD